ncbi:acyl-CoA thioesterase [Streptomyces sp. NPDC090075]|uniref:acyl-CoA thioesterase n=1 Tax=Streptomyces sp. NPDC090075 TaxID=3365937 RepID=UPI00382587B0
MNGADPLSLLSLEPAGPGRYAVPMPPGSQEGGNVVFGGQLMAQMIMASAAASDGSKYVKSMQVIFSRAGLYAAPIHLEVEPFHTGRTWASDLITARQGDRLLTRALVLSTSDEPDLVAHQLLPPPDVSGPDTGEIARGIVFPGAEVRTAKLSSETSGGVPVLSFWTRLPGPCGSLPASQAVLAWATNGWLIELSMRPHRDRVRIEDAHRSLSTGVIAQTLNFHREFDAGSWILVSQEATFAGKGRVHGRGVAHTEDGTLVATFSQDSMVRPGGHGAGSPL